MIEPAWRAERRRRGAILKHLKTKPVLEIYPAEEVFPSMGRHEDHFVFAYRDQVIGSIKVLNTGGLKTGEWLWSISLEPYDVSMQGTEPTQSEAAKALATRFRKWIEANGELKPIPRNANMYSLYVSQRLTENARRQPHEWRR